jgi:hypothetical protein
VRSDIVLNILPGHTYTFPSTGGFGAEMNLWAAVGKFAYVTNVGPTELALGGGAQVSHLDARGVKGAAPSVAYSGSVNWPALQAGAVLTTRVVGWVSLRLDADAVAPLQRPVLHIDPVGVVYRPSLPAGRLGAGVEVQF